MRGGVVAAEAERRLVAFRLEGEADGAALLHADGAVPEAQRGDVDEQTVFGVDLASRGAADPQVASEGELLLAPAATVTVSSLT